ncbi:MAG TPA: 50S ribosomal protein L11 methyltransferase [Candidatus Udaeobacter sp.]
MYVWRKRAELHWLKTHEHLLQAQADGQLVIVQKPGRKRLEVEITCRSRDDSDVLLKKFGGCIETLPRNWIQRFAGGESKPIKIGKRLVIVGGINQLQRCSVRCPQRTPDRRVKSDALRTPRSTAPHIKPALLAIPASLAFGTGEHATTAMSLRLLEQLTSSWKPGWSLVDLGTGSGILALAARRLGAGRVTGIDNDPKAISVAKSNARLNKIRCASFQLGDVRKCKSAQENDVTTANLYSELLIEIVPKLRSDGWLILSGILLTQENELSVALHRNECEIISTKRRGKWVAILARRTATVPAGS